MTSSSVKSFEDSLMGHISSLLSTVILPSVVDYYKNEKGLESSVEDLINYLKITPSNALIPPVVKSTSRSKKSSQTSEALEEKPQPGEGCVYMFVRGNNKGKYCGKTCFPGLNYCKWCKGKKEAIKDMMRGGKGSSVSKKTSSERKRNSGSAESSSKQEEDDILNVHNYVNMEDHFIHPETNFIIKEQDDVFYVIAKEAEDGQLYTLTDEEKISAKKLKLTSIDDEEEEQKILEELKKLVGKDKGKENVEESDVINIPTVTDPMISQNTSNIPILPTIPDVPSIGS